MASPRLPGEKEASFRGVLNAVLNQIRLGSRGAQKRASQSVRASGLRTSGVGQIPRIAVENNRQAAEASAIAGLGRQRLGGLQALQNIREQGSINLSLLNRQGAIAGEQSRSAGRRSFQRALIGAGASIFGGIFGGPLGAAAGKKGGDELAKRVIK